MLFKTMVINSTAGGVPESTSPAMQQFNIEPGVAHIIADKIKKLLMMENNEMVGLGGSSRKFVINNYDIKKLNKTILLHYKKGKQAGPLKSLLFLDDFSTRLN